MKKKQLVYVLLGDGLYGIAELTRRHPGEVWSADLTGSLLGRRYCTVSVTNFGGVVGK